MWQRIQTLYLGIASLLIVSMFWCSLSSIVMPDGSSMYIRYTDNTLFTAWLVILTVLQVLALGGYRWRMKQFRVVIFTALANLGFLACLVFYCFQVIDSQIMSWTSLFPLAAAILDFSAARNILLDEAIVFSANRLRSRRKK